MPYHLRSPRFYDDGLGRPFISHLLGGTPTPREIIAETLATADGCGEIRPNHWATAGRCVMDLREQFTLTRKSDQPGK